MDFNGTIRATGLTGDSEQGCDEDCYVVYGDAKAQFIEPLELNQGITFSPRGELQLIFPGKNQVAADPYSGIPPTAIAPNPVDDTIRFHANLKLDLEIEKFGFRSEGNMLGKNWNTFYSAEGERSEADEFRLTTKVGQGSFRPYSQLRPYGFNSPFGGLPPEYLPTTSFFAHGGFRNFFLGRLRLDGLAGVGIDRRGDGVVGPLGSVFRGTADFDLSAFELSAEVEYVEAKAATDPLTYRMLGRGHTKNWPIIRLMAFIPDLNLLLFGGLDYLSLDYTSESIRLPVEEDIFIYYIAAGLELNSIYEGLAIQLMRGVQDISIDLPTTTRANSLSLESRLTTVDVMFPFTPLNRDIKNGGLTLFFSYFLQQSEDNDGGTPHYENTGFFIGGRFFYNERGHF